MFNDLPCIGNCALSVGQNVSVAGTVTTTGIDFRLRAGGRITGTVLFPTGALTTSGIRVEVYDASGQFVTFGQTDSLGRFTSNAGLRTGTYYLRTANTLGFTDVLYGGLACGGGCNVTAGQAIQVTDGVTTFGVDLRLQGGAGP